MEKENQYTGAKWIDRAGEALSFLAVVAALATALSLLLPVAWRESTAQPLVYDSALVIQDDSAAIFGNVTVSVEDGLSLAYAQLLLNGSPAGDFGAGQVTVRVYPGDVLAVDMRAYPQSLRFYLSAASASIDLSRLLTEVGGSNSILPLGTIEFK